MIVKSYKGKVFGAELTASEKKAMNIEINRQIVERDKKYAADIDAMILYTLMAHYGWKKKRLKRFWDAFKEEHEALREFYQMDEPGDGQWLAHKMLMQNGINIHDWYKETNENEHTT